jgi:hypothetical protein
VWLATHGIHASTGFHKLVLQAELLLQSSQQGRFINGLFTVDIYRLIGRV